MKKLHKLQQILGEMPDNEKYLTYLPSYEFVQTIIQAVNEHRFAFAEDEIKKSEEVYLLLYNNLNSDERKWYESVLQDLRAAISSAK